MFKKIILSTLFLALVLLPNIGAQASTSEPESLTIIKAGEIVNTNLYTIAEQVIIEGRINGDLIAASNNIVVSGYIAGDIIALGENIVITGQVDGNVRVLSSYLELAGPVARNVTVLADKVVIKDGAQIAWDAFIASSDLENNGQITGQLTHREFNRDQKEESNPWSWLWPFIYKLFCALAVGLVLIFIFRKAALKISHILETTPRAVIIPGLLSLFLTPLAVIILAITVIGLPLAAIVFALWLILLYLAKIFSALVIGQLILKRLVKKPEINLVWPLLLGLTLTYLLLAIPLVGPLLNFIIIVTGLGAFYLYVTNQSRNL